MTRSNVYYCSGAIVLITDIDHTGTDEHYAALKALKEAVDVVGATFPIHDEDRNLVIHGLDVSQLLSRHSEEDQVHGDFIEFVVGATG